MFFSVFAISSLLAVQAVPLGYEVKSEFGVGISRGILDEVVGSSVGVGRGGIERSGSEYGRRGNVGSSNGYGEIGYGREGGFSSHDIGHLEHDYKQITESHVSEGHNSGHSGHYGIRGHESGGHGRYGAERDDYGGRHHIGLEI